MKTKTRNGKKQKRSPRQHEWVVRQRVLKIWNGAGHGVLERQSVYIAAYSLKQAAELLAKVSQCTNRGFENAIRTYYSAGCWGKPMNGIVPTEPCVYLQDGYGGKPVRVA